MDAETKQSWFQSYPLLENIQDDAWIKCLDKTQLHHSKAHDIVFHDNGECHWYFFLLKGSIRVQKNSINGHSIALYHLKPGDTCELTTLSLLANKHYSGEAIAETDIELIYISAKVFAKTLAKSSGFQQFVFSSLEKGVSELIHLIETVAFHHIDQRLANFLLSTCDKTNCIHATHSDISTELGTAREVVSRVLKSFEQHHYVSLHRGWIELLDQKKLYGIANEEAM